MIYNNHIAQALKNACNTIEAQQGEPLDLEQAVVVDSICQALNIDVAQILSPRTLMLINGDPNPQPDPAFRRANSQTTWAQL